MFQQVTPAFSPQSHFCRISGLMLRCCLMLLLLASLISSLHAATVTVPNWTKEMTAVSDTTIQASVCSGDSYFFDGQFLHLPGEYTATYPGADGSDSIVTLILAVLPVSLTNLEASICEGESYPFNGLNLDTSGIYSITLDAANGCDSIVSLRLTVLPPIKTFLHAGICQGTGFVFQGDTLTESGVYSIVLGSAAGCDSIVSLQLDVVDYFNTPLNVLICPGDTYFFGGVDLSSEGIYTDSLTAIGGCDSIVILNLKIRPAITTHITASICSGSSYLFNGETLTDIGEYDAVFTAVNGCDSTVTLSLEVVDFYDFHFEATICEGESFYFDEDYLEVEGEYIYQYTAIGGCDSTVTLQLHVLPGSVGSASATICPGDEYDYQGNILTYEGVYTFVFDAANGCDSTVTFTLNVLPPIQSFVEAAICNGETYDFDGTALADAGVYTAVYEAVNGCDSTVTLNLTVLQTPHTELSVAICEGASYDYNGETLTDAGNYSFVLTAANGCDSTVNLTLSVHPAVNSNLHVDICEGDAYEFDGNLLTDAGTYTGVFSDQNGCDSTVTLTLSLLPQQHATLEAVICASEIYHFNGQALNTAGTYMAVLTGANGCDSTVVLTLTVLPTQSTSIAATICEGESFNYFGLALTTAGDHEFIFGGENGCDSTVIITLTVLPVPKTSILATICAGDSYDYQGASLTDAGDYQYTYTATNGCDSIVTVSLSVLPTLSAVIAVSLCEGSIYVYNNDTLTTSGAYDYTFTGSNGCDSTTTLLIEFVQSFLVFQDATVCFGESYVFGSDTLTESGNYEHLYTAQGGCDSIVSLTLTVLPLNQSSTEASICAGSVYSFNGTDLTDAGVYSVLLSGANGCDSLAVLQLHVLPVHQTAIEATICDNENYAFNGLSLSDAGTYTAMLTGSNGCDSTVVLTLSVLPLQGSSSIATICGNQTYDFYGQALSQTGTYTVTFDGVNGCDSVVTLELTVLPLAQSAFSATVCNGEPFEYNGDVFTQSGEYHFVFPAASANGCDSLVTLFLTIFPVIPPTHITASICDGGSYDFHGTILTTSGTYTVDLASSLGCDSTIILNLNVWPTEHTTLSANICPGESYPFNGQNLTVAGTYTANLQTWKGCDSTVVLTLTVTNVNTDISLSGNTITAQATNATYQWVNCANNQPVAGATQASFTPSATGNYAVVVTQGGCIATSTCVFVQIVSTGEPLADHAWSIQPNPASTYAQIVFSETTEEALWLEVHDLAGRLLYSQAVVSGTQTIDIYLNSLPDGMLLVRLTSDKGVSSKRLIKAGR